MSILTRTRSTSVASDASSDDGPSAASTKLAPMGVAAKDVPLPAPPTEDITRSAHNPAALLATAVPAPRAFPQFSAPESTHKKAGTRSSDAPIAKLPEAPPIAEEALLRGQEERQQAQIRSAVRRTFPGVAAAGLELFKLSRGFANATYEVRGPGGLHVIAKVGAATSQVSDKRAEELATRWAAQHGLSPSVRRFPKSDIAYGAIDWDNVVITEHHPGHHVDADSLTEVQLRKLGELAKSIHQTPAALDGVPFTGFDTAAFIDRMICDTVAAERWPVAMPPADMLRHALALVRHDISTQQPDDENEPCVMHGDFRLDNILFDGDNDGAPTAIDWELAGQADPGTGNDPLFDLLFFSITASLTPEQEALLFQTYFGDRPVPQDRIRLARALAYARIAAWSAWSGVPECAAWGVASATRFLELTTYRPPAVVCDYAGLRNDKRTGKQVLAALQTSGAVILKGAPGTIAAPDLAQSLLTEMTAFAEQPQEVKETLKAADPNHAALCGYRCTTDGPPPQRGTRETLTLIERLAMAPTPDSAMLDETGSGLLSHAHQLGKLGRDIAISVLGWVWEKRKALPLVTPVTRLTRYSQQGSGVREHIDYMPIAVMFGETTPGLEIRIPDGTWRGVGPIEPGETLVMVGTGANTARNKLRACEHRVCVRVPDANEGRSSALVFGCARPPHLDALLAAGDGQAERLESALTLLHRAPSSGRSRAENKGDHRSSETP